MKIKIEINTENAAFEGCENLEVARILAKAAKRIEGQPCYDFRLLDMNGNEVGAVRAHDPETLDDDKRAEIGGNIAEFFGMKRARKNQRYMTAWGSKTALGLYHTFLRVAEMIENGEEIKP